MKNLLCEMVWENIGSDVEPICMVTVFFYSRNDRRWDFQKIYEGEATPSAKSQIECLGSALKVFKDKNVFEENARLMNA